MCIEIDISYVVNTTFANSVQISLDKHTLTFSVNGKLNELCMSIKQTVFIDCVWHELFGAPSTMQVRARAQYLSFCFGTRCAEAILNIERMELDMRGTHNTHIIFSK